MADQPLVLIPNPLLKREAEPAGEPDPELAAELVDTMLATPGCVGLTAPQLGVNVRLLAVDVSASRQGRQEPWRTHGRLLLFDPELLHAEGIDTAREACVSVPTYTCDVPRALRVVVRGVSPEGLNRVIHADGFEARVLQHELDHLDGRLILDRVACVRPQVFRCAARPLPQAQWGSKLSTVG